MQKESASIELLDYQQAQAIFQQSGNKSAPSWDRWCLENQYRLNFSSVTLLVDVRLTCQKCASTHEKRLCDNVLFERLNDLSDQRMQNYNIRKAQAFHALSISVRHAQKDYPLCNSCKIQEEQVS